MDLFAKGCDLCCQKRMQNPQRDHLVARGIGNKLIESIKETCFFNKSGRIFLIMKRCG